MKRLLLAVILCAGCIHRPPQPPPTPTPTATPEPSPIPDPRRDISYYRESGADNERACSAAGADAYHVSACGNGYRPLQPLLTAHMMPDCAQGGQAEMGALLECLRQYAPTVERERPGLPWVLWIDERGHQESQYAVTDWLRDPARACWELGWDEYCDVTATEDVIQAHVDDRYTRQRAAYGRTCPVVSTIGVDAVLGEWCGGWRRWPVLAIEAYSLPPTTYEELRHEFVRARELMPAGQRLAIVAQQYSRNHAITDEREMVERASWGWRLARELGAELVLAFSGYRPSGTLWNRPTLYPVGEWGRACYEGTGPCTSPPMPAPTPMPTPDPTPDPTDQGALAWDRNAVSVQEHGAALRTATLSLVWRGYGSAARPASCSWRTAALVGPGWTGEQRGVCVFTSEAPVCEIPVEMRSDPAATGHTEVSVHVEGEANVGPGDRYARAVMFDAQPSVEWFASSFSVSPGNTVGTLLRGGSTADPASVCWRAIDGTAIDGRDYNRGSAAGYCVEMPAGKNTLNINVEVYSGATRGTEFALDILRVANGWAVGGLSRVTVRVK